MLAADGSNDKVNTFPEGTGIKTLQRWGIPRTEEFCRIIRVLNDNLFLKIHL